MADGDIYALHSDRFRRIDLDLLRTADDPGHKPRLLLLCGLFRPERHGTMTGVMKAQSGWLPLSPWGGIRPTQGKTLAVMQVSGASHSFNAVNQMRLLGRRMPMVKIPKRSRIPKAWLECGAAGRLPETPFRARIVAVMEELVKCAWLVRGRAGYVVDRYSERVESAENVHKRVSLRHA